MTAYIRVVPNIMIFNKRKIKALFSTLFNKIGKMLGEMKSTLF